MSPPRPSSSSSASSSSNNIVTDIHRSVLGKVGHHQDSGAESSRPQAKAIDALKETLATLIARTDLDSPTVFSNLAGEVNHFFHASGTAIAMKQGGAVVCVASAGDTAPDVGTELNVSSGISGICFRTGVTQKCLDARTDHRVDAAICKALGIASILVVPVKDEEHTVGLVEVFAEEEFFFNNNDTLNLEQIAALILQSWRQRRTAQPTPLPVASPNVVAPAPQSVSDGTDVSTGPLLSASRNSTDDMASILPSFQEKAPASAASSNKPSAKQERGAVVGADSIAGRGNVVSIGELRNEQSASQFDNARFDDPEDVRVMLAKSSPDDVATATTLSPRSKYLIMGALVLTLGLGGWSLARLLPKSLSPASAVPATATVAAPDPETQVSGDSESAASVSADKADSVKPNAAKAAGKSSTPASAEKSRFEEVVLRGPVATKDPVLPLAGVVAAPGPGLTTTAGTSSSGAGAAGSSASGTGAGAGTSSNTAPSVSIPPQRLPAGILATAQPAANADSLKSAAPSSVPPTSEIEPEVVIRRVSPSYPSSARTSRIAGEVVVVFTVNKDGKVVDPILEKGHPLLGAAALDAVRKWKYKPYMLNGLPQDVQTKVRFNFNP